jgi:hypothetical protein
MTRSMLIICSTFMLAITGCKSIGPGTVSRDRFDYVNAVSDSWKRQMLLNLVKTRYADAPVFFDVSSVISQYSIEGQLGFRAGQNDPPWGDNWALSGGGKYSDRPTITYTPLSGDKFTESIMRPVSVGAVLSLMQAAYPADFVLRVAVQTINGLENRYGGDLMAREANPDFYELGQAMREIQKQGKMGMRVREDGARSATVLILREDPEKPLPETSRRVDQLLGIAPELHEYRVVYGAIASQDSEIAMLTRSMLQIMVELASYIDVPAQDVTEGRVRVTLQGSRSDVQPLIQIHSGTGKPKDAFTAIKYRGNWFWIDDRDYDSKRMLSFIMMLFSLTETGPGGSAPIVTVPTG